MPNHCETDMYIRGSDEDYERVHGEPDSQWSGDYSGSRGG